MGSPTIIRKSSRKSRDVYGWVAIEWVSTHAVTSKRSARTVRETRKNYLKVLRTAEDHQCAMSRMLTPMRKNPPRGSAESEEMEILGLLIEKYDAEHYPITPPDPIEAIKFEMDQEGLKKKDLIPYIGSASKVTEVPNGSRSLSLNMIRV